MQEEIEVLKRLEKDLKWSVTEFILLLSAKLLKEEDSEVSTEDILNQPHDTDNDLLLETVLCDKRESTLKYQKQIKIKCKIFKQNLINLPQVLMQTINSRKQTS